MKATVLECGRVVDPSRGIDETGSVVIRGGTIAAAGAGALNQGAPEGAEVIDCRGLAIVPGLVDARVFIGEPGAEHRESHDTTFRWGKRCPGATAASLWHAMLELAIT